MSSIDEATIALASQVSKLLKPIRELAANWDIDIASELEDYITNVSQLELEISGKQINFAQAALIIQGSAAIYSKKVEYLYGLIFKTLENVTQQENLQTNRKASSINDEGKDVDAPEDDPLEFLSLDDVMESGVAPNLTLDEHWLFDDTSDEIPSNSMLSTQQRAAMKFAFSLGNSANMSSLNPFSKLSGSGDSEISSLSLNKQSQQQQQSSISDYKMNSATLSSTGALMISSPLDIFSTFHQFAHLQHTGNSLGNGIKIGPGVDGIETDSVTSTTTATTKGFMNDDHDGGFDDDYHQASSSNDFHIEIDTGYDHEDVLRSQIQPNDQITDEQNGIEKMMKSLEVKNSLQASDKQVLHAMVDPWAMWDPHDPGEVQPKPFKLGKQSNWKIPDLKNSELSDEEEEEFNDEIKIDFKSSNLKPILFEEFGYIYDQQMKKKQAEKLKSRKEAIKAIARKGGVDLDSDELNGIELHEDEDEMELADGGDEGTGAGIPKSQWDGVDLFAGADDDNYGGFDDNGNVNSNNDYPINGFTMDDGTGDGNPSNPILNFGLADYNPHISYEDHCRARLEEYFRTARQSIEQTEVSARIEEWSIKLTPLLVEQESRPSFDIHKYGEQLINMFSDDQKQLAKQGSVKVVARLEDLIPRSAAAFEVSRTFSSMLQLANMGNIQIIPKRNKEGIHDISLQLITDISRVDISNISRKTGEAENNSMENEMKSNNDDLSKDKHGQDYSDNDEEEMEKTGKSRQKKTASTAKKNTKSSKKSSSKASSSSKSTVSKRSK